MPDAEVVKAKILLVESDAFQRSILAKRIERRGQEVHPVASLSGITELIQANPDIGLVLMDLGVAVEAHLTAIRAIREQYRAIELPIIVITANEQENAVVQCLQAGANDFVKKPIAMEVLMARLVSLVSLQRLHRAEIAQAEVDALKSMIITYHHELNNPLAIAVGALQLFERKGEPAHLEKAKDALNRMGVIIKKIRTLSDSPIIKSKYSNKSKMIKL